MLITLTDLEPITLPIDVAFTLDIRAIIPQEIPFYGVDLGIGNGVTYAFEMRETEVPGVYTVIPTQNWVDANIAAQNTPNPVGALTLFTSAGNLTINILPSIPQSQMTPTWRGTAGTDTLIYDAQDPMMEQIHLIDTSGGSDRVSLINGAGVLLGRSGDDTLSGWNGNDALYGGGGNDALYAGAGSDRLIGLNGDDRMFGGEGDDSLLAGSGNDNMIGGDGNDTLSAGEGYDTLRGEDGNDRLLITNWANVIGPRPTGLTLAYGGDGTDTIGTEEEEHGAQPDAKGENVDAGAIELYGGAGGDSIFISSFSEGAIYGGIGDDFIAAGMANDATVRGTIYGGDGNDGLYAGYAIDLYAGNGDDIVYIQNGGTVRAGDGNDLVQVGGFSDVEIPVEIGIEVYGGAGLDTLYGERGNDTLHGGNDADDLRGYSGQDSLYGGAGEDTLDGGVGADYLSGGADNDSLRSQDRLNLSIDDINSQMAGLQDTLMGGAGDDFLYADRMGHQFYGGSGNDFLTVDFFTIQSVDTTIMDGGIGNDVLQAGDRSTTTGGAGNDLFILDIRGNNENIMYVTDFTFREDKIDVVMNAGSIANIVGFSDQGLAGISNTGVSSLSWERNGINGIRVYFDEEGDGSVDGTFDIVGINTLTFTDLNINV